MSTMSKWKQYSFFIAGAIAMMAMTLSSYGIATVTPALLRRFNAMQHYTLTSLMASIGLLLFLPIVGKLTDSVGRRPLLIAGGLISLVSSLVTGFANSFPLFIVMRALITVGTACLTPLPSATLPFIFDKSKLPQLYGIQGSFLALGTFFGSTIAGFFADLGVAWIGVAYPGALLFLGAMVMLALCPDVPRKPMPNIDFGGIALMFCIVGPLMYVSSFGNRMGWGNPYIIGAFILLIIAILCFITVERKVTSPLVNLNLFKNPIFTGTLLCTFLMTWYQFAMRVYVPLKIQNVMGISAAISGSVLLPRSILNIIFPTFCGAWITKKQSARCWKGLLFTGLLIAGGSFMLSFTSPNTTLMVFFIGLGVTGIAESFKQAALTPALQGALTSENMGSGMSLNSMMGAMGSAVSGCIFGVVFDAIAPNTKVISDLAKAGNAVFLVATISGLLVCFLACFLVRPKNPASLTTASA
jgi:MFS family permease